MICEVESGIAACFYVRIFFFCDRSVPANAQTYCGPAVIGCIDITQVQMTLRGFRNEWWWFGGNGVILDLKSCSRRAKIGGGHNSASSIAEGVNASVLK